MFRKVKTGLGVTDVGACHQNKTLSEPIWQGKIFTINYADFQLTRVSRVYPQKIEIP